MKYRYTDNLYTDIERDSAFEKKLKTLARKKPDPKMYLITYPLGGSGLLEIYAEAELLQPYYRKQRKIINVLGVTSSRDAAKKLIPDILNDCMAEVGSLDIHEFVKRHLSDLHEID